MTTTIQSRSFFDVVIGEPLELAKSQPHQILLSTGSVALMGSFASSNGIVHPFVGFLIAIGVEWAYLRGLAYDSRAQSAWGAILNWSAFGIVVLWGVLWVAQMIGALEDTRGGWWLAAAHVVPVAWLSLCSAQCHRAALGVERRRENKLQAERDRLALDLAQKEQDLILWERAQEAKMRLKMQAHNAPKKMRRDALSAPIDAVCPKCGIALERPQWLAARRWGHCSSCKES